MNVTNTIMHKLRNQRHIEILNSLLGFIPYSMNAPLSKRALRRILVYCKWDKKKAAKMLEDNDFYFIFAEDD